MGAGLDVRVMAADGVRLVHGGQGVIWVGLTGVLAVLDRRPPPPAPGGSSF